MISETFDEMAALTMREIKRWYRQRFAIVFTVITPLFWLVLFGKSFNVTQTFSLPPTLPPEVAGPLRDAVDQGIMNLFGTRDYFTFMACGMLAILVLFTSMWSGMSIVWDRRFGFLNKLLAAPIATSSIVISRVASSVLRGMVQAVLIFTIALGLGLQLQSGFTVLHALGVFASLGLLSIGLSGIFVAISFSIKNHETMIAMANMVNLPLMFASNTLFPLSQMPDWLQYIAKGNPLTYAVSVVRGLVIGNIGVADLMLNFSILVAFATLFSAMGILISRKVLNR